MLEHNERSKLLKKLKDKTFRIHIAEKIQDLLETLFKGKDRICKKKQKNKKQEAVA